MAAWEAPGFVATVVGPDGKPIREFNDEGRRTVRVPFNTEYKLRFKNTTKARAYVRVEIDGMDALSGKKLILGPGQTNDLERFLNHDNNSGSKFRFVEAGSIGVVDPTSAANGFVRIIFEPESVPVVTTSINTGGTFTTTSAHIPLSRGGVLRGMSMGVNTGVPSSTSFHVSNNASIGAAGSAAYASSANGMVMDVLNAGLSADLGATAEGSHSTQQFRDTNEWFATLPPVVLDLWIKGPKAEPPKPFNVMSYDHQPIIINGVSFAGCTSCISNDYVSINIPRNLVNLIR